MRVTSQMIAANMLGNMNSLRSRLATLHQQISSGERISKVSEDPASGAEVIRIQGRQQQLEQWKAGLDNAKDWLRATETAVSDIISFVGKARDLAVAGSNGAITDEGRQAMVPEAERLLDSLLATLNEKHLDNALFGGFVSDTDPFTFDMTTGAVTYNGDTGSIQRTVGPGVTLGVNVSGDRVADPTNPDNVLKVVWDLVQSLKNGPASAVGAQLDRLDSVQDSFIALRTEIGAKDLRLEQLESKAKSTSLHLETMLEQAQGVEVEKAIMELAAAETAYRAALQVGGRIMPQTLADFLR